MSGFQIEIQSVEIKYSLRSSFIRKNKNSGKGRIPDEGFVRQNIDEVETSSFTGSLTHEKL